MWDEWMNHHPLMSLIQFNLLSSPLHGLTMLSKPLFSILIGCKVDGPSGEIPDHRGP